jgi:hypothetical protein
MPYLILSASLKKKKKTVNPKRVQNRTKSSKVLKSNEKARDKNKNKNK